MVEVAYLLGDLASQLLLILPESTKVNQGDQLNLWDSLGHPRVLVGDYLIAIVLSE